MRIILLFFLLQTNVLVAQSNTFSIAYGKRLLFLEQNHQVALQYQKIFTDSGWFWGGRISLSSDETSLLPVETGRIPLFVVEEGGFPYIEQIEVGEIRPGVAILKTRDNLRSTFCIATIFGKTILRKSSVKLKLFGGLGMAYEQTRGFYSGSVVTVVDENFAPIESADLYFAAYKRGLEQISLAGFQIASPLGSHFSIGVEGEMRFFNFEGLDVYHSLFVTKSF